jgi:hypothetical protein
MGNSDPAGLSVHEAIRLDDPAQAAVGEIGPGRSEARIAEGHAWDRMPEHRCMSTGIKASRQARAPLRADNRRG